MLAQDSGSSLPEFNLWTEPWIILQKPDGSMETLGIEQTLLRAPDFVSLYEMSPLVEVGVHRLLLAVLQAVLQPRKNLDLENLWNSGTFPEKRLRAWGKRYKHRFDIFSLDGPFLQSADLSLDPAKNQAPTSAGYLFSEIPTGEEVTLYRPALEEDEVICPACAAGGLTAIAPFAGIGGRGFFRSINGESPLYVLPQGKSLFESLAASLVTPSFFPSRNLKRDSAWWLRVPQIKSGKTVRQPGYLQGLTFPARRVRLFPESSGVPCRRCGRSGACGIRKIVYEMGEIYAGGSRGWIDPFVMYRRTGKEQILPVQFDNVNLIWREISLVLCSSHVSGGRTPESFLNFYKQLSELKVGEAISDIQLRCVGIRRDQAKTLEWIDYTYPLRPTLFHSRPMTPVVMRMVIFSVECASIMRTALAALLKSTPRANRSLRSSQLPERLEGIFWPKIAAIVSEWVALNEKTRKPEREIPQQLDHVKKLAEASFTQVLLGQNPGIPDHRHTEPAISNVRQALGNARRRCLDEWR